MRLVCQWESTKDSKLLVTAVRVQDLEARSCGFPKRIAVILLSNLSVINTNRLAMQMADIYLSKKTIEKKPSKKKSERASLELDTFYGIVFDEGHLIATHRKHEDFPLTVITPDYYSGTEWFFRKVHFTRDNTNSINGFLVTGSRVRNLRFTKH